MAITLRQLTHARALAHHRSFREAALALNLTQPALTRSIQALEATLGLPLFDRMPGGVEPTRLGALLLEKGERVLRETRDLEREMGLLLGLQAGNLAVAAGPYPGCALVPEALARCLARIPGLQCRLLTGAWQDMVGELLSRRCELAVGELSAASGDARFDTTPLGPDALHFVCRPAHPLAGRRASLAEVMAFPLAACRVPARLAVAFPPEARAGMLDAISGEWLPAIEVDSVDAAIRVVATSDAVTAMPLHCVERQLLAAELVVVDVPDNRLTLDAGLITLEGRALSPAASAFIEEIARVRRDHAARERNLRRQLGIKASAG